MLVSQSGAAIFEMQIQIGVRVWRVHRLHAIHHMQAGLVNAMPSGLSERFGPHLNEKAAVMTSAVSVVTKRCLFNYFREGHTTANSLIVMLCEKALLVKAEEQHKTQNVFFLFYFFRRF